MCSIHYHMPSNKHGMFCIAGNKYIIVRKKIIKVNWGKNLNESVWNQSKTLARNSNTDPNNHENVSIFEGAGIKIFP